MKNTTYVDQCDTIRTSTKGRPRGAQTMRKLSLVLAALSFLAVSAEAAPEKVVEGTGKAIGPVIGPGVMVLTAPDGNPVVVSVAPPGFVNSLPPNSSYPFFYLNDPTCSTQAYLLAISVPVEGFVLLDDQNEIFSPSATILYPNTPYGLVGSTPTYAWNYDDSSKSYFCQPAPLPSSVPIGPVASFPVSYSAPFSARSWFPPPPQ